jgi:OPT family small oligopeptide transporter
MLTPNLAMSESSHSAEKKDLTETLTYDADKSRQIAERLGQRAEADHIAPSADVEYIMDQIQNLRVEEALEILEKVTFTHDNDPNFPFQTMVKIKTLLLGQEHSDMSQEDWEFDVKAEAGIIHFYSPYPEVRSVTLPFDDPAIPVETWRAYVLGMIWVIIGMGANTFFEPRFPAVSISTDILQLLLYPCGKALELLPDWGFTFRGKRHSLNPGPWSYKEQMLSTILIYNSIGAAYVVDNFQVQKLPMYYDLGWVGPGYEILLALSNQCLGIGLAGLLRRFVIYPVRAIWPSILPTMALNQALLVGEKKRNIHGWTISRYWFFFSFAIGSFLYYWIPGFLFQAVSNFNWMTWIAPDNFNLAVVTGSDLGMGFNPISTFDWNIINSFGPLMTPFWSLSQLFIGTFLSGLIILGLYYSNYKWSAYLPINSSDVFDNTGNLFNTSGVMTNDQFDEAKYQAYSPAYYSAANIVLYGAFFACYPLNVIFVIGENFQLVKEAFSSLVYALYDDFLHIFKGTTSAASNAFRGQLGEAGNSLGDGFRSARRSVYTTFDDPHCRMMRNYKETPDWWFFVVLIIAFVFGIVVITVYPLNTSVWTLFFVVGLNMTFLIPMSIIQATAGTSIGLNVITELIIGYACPNNPEALMLVKAFGYNIDGQADGYLAPNKMGHYAKIPPRAIFRAQVSSTIVTSFVSVGVMNWVFSNVQGLCTPGQQNKFNCENGATIYYASSVVWGLIGPKRVFGGIYPELKYCFLIGALLGGLWLGTKRLGPYFRAWTKSRLSEGSFNVINTVLFKPLSSLDIVNPVLINIGFLEWAPYNLFYQWGGLFSSFTFMYIIKRRWTGWFEKYNYVLSAALTAGVAFSAIIIFFATGYNNTVALSWWGNNVPYAGIDGGNGQQALLPIPDVGYFGMAPGTYPV